MKRILFLVFVALIISCSTAKKSSSDLREEQLSITRKYIGNFVEYYHTGPNIVGGVDLIWIRTTVYSNFGKISAYGKNCTFAPGEKIYLRPVYSTPGNYGNWEYQIENDSAVTYKVSEYRYENNIFLRSRSL
jgi:hypothetical protein